MEFCERLVNLRKEKKETQVQLAEAIGITSRQLQMLEAGQSFPQYKTFCALADHFGVSLDYLVGRSRRTDSMVLENKLGITSSAELAREEERRSKARALELFEKGLLDQFEIGTFRGLAQIHAYLFGEIYEFAGQVRTVNIAKGNFRFAPVLYLQAALEQIGQMPQSTFDEIIEKYVEMNVAHPFREGNGRSARLWLDAILKKELRQVVDWSRVDREDYLLAMERSPVRDLEIKTLLKAALTDQINDREVYMKGVDASYRYEGYDAYKTAEANIRTGAEP